MGRLFLLNYAREIFGAEVCAAPPTSRGGGGYSSIGPFGEDLVGSYIWTGLVMHNAGVRMRIEDALIDQRFRPVQVDVVSR